MLLFPLFFGAVKVGNFSAKAPYYRAFGLSSFPHFSTGNGLENINASLCAQKNKNRGAHERGATPDPHENTLDNINSFSAQKFHWHC